MIDGARCYAMHLFAETHALLEKDVLAEHDTCMKRLLAVMEYDVPYTARERRQ